jgi:hypothetical protein
MTESNCKTKKSYNFAIIDGYDLGLQIMVKLPSKKPPR